MPRKQPEPASSDEISTKPAVSAIQSIDEAGKRRDTPRSDTAADRPLPWHPILAVVVVLVIYFGSAFIGQFLLEAFFASHNYSTAQLKQLENSSYVQFAYYSVVEVLTLVALWLFMRKYKVGFSRLGFKKPRFGDFGLAMLSVVPYFLFYAALLATATHLFPSINVNQQQQLGFSKDQQTIGMILTFLSLVVWPPLVEEIMVRGFLFGSLLKGLKVVPAVVLTSVIFASAHLQIGSGAPLLWVAAIDTFSLSLVLCTLRYKTGSLWPGIFLHAMKNSIAFISLFVFHLS